MRAVIIFSLSVIFFQAKAWSPIRSSFDLTSPHKKFHTITECVHVTTEDGDFYFKKNPHILSPNLRNGINIVDAASPMTVCGLYFITDPDKIIEISIKHLDVDCETDGLMAFVDGWEWNGQYFPSEKDHTLNLDRRVTEFCSESSKWSMRTQRRIYISSQNAALLQYRIPVRGSFIANVRYLENPTPCNIMVDGLAPFYTLKNFGKKTNCTLIAMYPAAISIIGMNIGNNYDEPNYDCEQPNALDRLEVGGAPGIDTTNMEKSTTVCGSADKPGPEQSIFCEVTSIRLVSSGLHNNYAKVSVRQATENDFASATLFCGV